MRPLRGSTVPIAAFTLQRQIPSGCTLLGNIKPSWRQSNKDIPAPFLPTFCQLKVVKLKLWRAWNCQMEGRHFDPNGKSTLCFHISGEIFSTFRASRLFFGAQHFLTGRMGEGGQLLSYSLCNLDAAANANLWCISHKCKLGMANGHVNAGVSGQFQLLHPKLYPIDQLTISDTKSRANRRWAAQRDLWKKIGFCPNQGG